MLEPAAKFIDLEPRRGGRHLALGPAHGLGDIDRRDQRLRAARAAAGWGRSQARPGGWTASRTRRAQSRGRARERGRSSAWRFLRHGSRHVSQQRRAPKGCVSRSPGGVAGHFGGLEPQLDHPPRIGLDADDPPARGMLDRLARRKDAPGEQEGQPAERVDLVVDRDQPARRLRAKSRRARRGRRLPTARPRADGTCRRPARHARPRSRRRSPRPRPRSSPVPRCRRIRRRRWRGGRAPGASARADRARPSIRERTRARAATPRSSAARLSSNCALNTSLM